MILTITIASVSIRKDMLETLLAELNRQINENGYEKDVEILVDDNDKRFLGTKRKEMLSIAQGLFTCAIDDDDWITENYIRLIVESIKANPSIDNLAINGIITTNGENPKKWVISCHFEDWYEKDDVYYRTPNHICPIRTDLARIADFDEVAWGEDYPFSQRMKPLLKNEAIIDEPLYIYQFSTTGSLHDYQQKKLEQNNTLSK
jgi:hypothetical protein